MKSARLFVALLLISLSATAFAQSDADKSFTQLKTLDGTWEGKVTTDVPMGPPGSENDPIHVSLRTTSRGHALLHEIIPTKSPDHPVTMMYLEGDQLMLTHFCDAGNRPRMRGKLSPDGKSVGFEFVDVAGPLQHGHMHDAKFTFIDADHHAEDWTFMMDKQTVHAHFDLHRVNAAAQKSGTGR
ncbi:MAG TPA: hypothetical protein VGC88_10540 [Terriglobales bacterium]|jgi:hypothetical protein